MILRAFSDAMMAAPTPLHRGVAARVIGVQVRVDDVLDRQRRDGRMSFMMPSWSCGNFASTRITPSLPTSIVTLPEPMLRIM